jgi:hypothetical protein
MLDGQEGQLRTACFCCARMESGLAETFPPLVKGGLGGWSGSYKVRFFKCSHQKASALPSFPCDNPVTGTSLTIPNPLIKLNGT